MTPSEDPTAVKAWLAATVLSLGALVSHGFGLSLVPALLPQVEATFSSGYGTLGLAVASGLLAYAVGGLIASQVLDWLPNRTVFNGTFVVVAVALGFGSIAGSAGLIAPTVIVMGAAAPISWAATAHIAGRVVPVQRRNLVMGAAAGGVGLGVVVNGSLLRLFDTPGAWRQALLLAAVMSIAVVVSSILVFRHSIDRPHTGLEMRTTSSPYRAVLVDPVGRDTVIASAVAGVGPYTYTSFLTTVSIVEMGSTAAAAGSLLWAMGVVGVVASLLMGRLSERASPLRVVRTIFLICGVGLGILAVSWSYRALAVAAVAVAALNYPVWGLLVVIALRHFDAPLALRAVSLGLVAAALLSSAAAYLSARWLDKVGSMRVPIVIVTAMTFFVALWLSRGRHLVD